MATSWIVLVLPWSTSTVLLLIGLGKLYRRTGKADQAREHLTTATAMYREMDMRFWLEQAEAEMRELTTDPG